MARRGNGSNQQGRGPALLFFFTGLGLLLLLVFGPIVWGERFDGGILYTPALGLMVVSVYVFVGVWLPSLDWAGLVARVLAALLAEREQNDGEKRDR